MKTKIGIAILLMMVSVNLSASVLGKISGKGVKHSAREYLQSCEGGDMHACYELGFALEGVDAVDLNHKKAEEYFKKACDGGYYDSCHFLAKYYEDDPNDLDAMAKSVKLHSLACDGGIDWACQGCFSAGLAYKDGAGVEKDLGKAIEYFKKDLAKTSDDYEGETDNVSCSLIKECEAEMSHKDDNSTLQ